MADSRCLFYMAAEHKVEEEGYQEHQVGQVGQNSDSGLIFSIKFSLNYEVEYLPTHHHMNLKSKSLSFCLDSSSLLDDSKVHDTMRRILLNMAVLTDQHLDSIVKVVSSRAKSMKNDPRNAACRILHVVMSLRVIWVKDFDREAALAWEELLPPGQEFSFSNLPATEHSVNLLEKLSFDKDCCSGQGQCPICLKEFDGGDDEDVLIRMPCLHVYHGDCIIKWLTSSHFCPSCRFPMPVFRIVDPVGRTVEKLFPFLKRKSCAPVMQPLERCGGKIRRGPRMSVRHHVY